MIVVDSNILAYLFLQSDFTPAAEALLARDPEWVAPPLWRSEFRNILAGYYRRGALTLQKVCTIQASAEALLVGAEFEPESAHVFDLVSRSDCSAYDCEFVALAEQLRLNLITMDKKVIREFPEIAHGLAV